MAEINPQTLSAALIFIDNSDSSIDGDFKPTRIYAEGETIYTICDFFKRGNQQSVFGFGGMSDRDFGLKVTFTSERNTLPHNINSIKTGGKLQLERALKCGILAMNQRPKEVKNQILFYLVGSQHDLTKETAETIAHIAHGKGICINIFAFGDEDINEEPLKYLIEKMNDSSHYNRIEKGPYSLSTAIINQYCTNFNTSIPQSSIDNYLMNDADDAQLQSVIAQSLREAGQNNADQEDPEIQAALAESLKMQNQDQGQEDDMDDELKEAFALSQQQFDDDQEQKDQQNNNAGGIQAEIDNIINDPEQLNNLYSEFDKQNKNDKDKDKKDDKDDKDKKDKK